MVSIPYQLDFLKFEKSGPWPPWKTEIESNKETSERSYGDRRLESNKGTIEQSNGETKLESNKETREQSYGETKILALSEWQGLLSRFFCSVLSRKLNISHQK